MLSIIFIFKGWFYRKWKNLMMIPVQQIPNNLAEEKISTTYVYFIVNVIKFIK